MHSLRNTLQNVRRVRSGMLYILPELAINLHADIGGPMRLAVLLAVQELINLGIIPVHDRHTGAATIPASNNTLRDVMIDEHSVHTREFLL